MANEYDLEDCVYEYLNDDSDETPTYDEYHCMYCGRHLEQIFESYEYQGFRGSREMWVCPHCE